MKFLLLIATLLVSAISNGQVPPAVSKIPSDLTMPDGTTIHGLFDRMTRADGKLVGVGVQAPGVVDAVISGKGMTFLVWVEPNTLTKELFQNFQDKVNAYVAYARDGRLIAQYPDAANTKLVLYLVLLVEQAPGRLDNIRSIAPQLKEMSLELVIREQYGL
jgi:hypothetical protein